VGGVVGRDESEGIDAGGAVVPAEGGHHPHARVEREFGLGIGPGRVDCGAKPLLGGPLEVAPRGRRPCPPLGCVRDAREQFVECRVGVGLLLLEGSNSAGRVGGGLPGAEE
jgi:hypothetical protein